MAENTVTISGNIYGDDLARGVNVFESVFEDMGIAIAGDPEVTDWRGTGNPSRIKLVIAANDIDDALGFAVPQAQDQLRALQDFYSLPADATGRTMEKNTVVVNMFGGPGSGKTTAALEVTEKLKKAGYVVEYAPEYAKELVWDIGSKALAADERMRAVEMLSGQYDNQVRVYEEQLRRIERCLGQCDFVVTDSPILLSLAYLKEATPAQREELECRAFDDFESMNNFNMLVERGREYEQAGRVQNEREARGIDWAVKDMLEENDVFYGTYSHDKIDKAIENMQKTLKRTSAKPSRPRTERAGEPKAGQESRAFPSPAMLEPKERGGNLEGITYTHTSIGDKHIVDLTFEYIAECEDWISRVYVDDGKFGNPTETVEFTSVHPSFKEAYNRAYERVTEEAGWMRIGNADGSRRMTIDEVFADPEESRLRGLPQFYGAEPAREASPAPRIDVKPISVR